jgi:Pyridoxamine 5'-phosphate oxidase
MASWKDVTTAAPELAARVVERFGANKHALIATVRRDGSPRLSGIETDFSDGELWLGMMPDSLKSADLQRDPRFSIHSAPIDLELADGDAKLSGRAELVTDEAFVAEYLRKFGEANGEAPEGADLFRVDVLDASIVTVDGNLLVIDSWRVGEAPKRQTRT